MNSGLLDKGFGSLLREKHHFLHPLFTLFRRSRSLTTFSRLVSYPLPDTGFSRSSIKPASEAPSRNPENPQKARFIWLFPLYWEWKSPNTPEKRSVKTVILGHFGQFWSLLQKTPKETERFWPS